MMKALLTDLDATIIDNRERRVMAVERVINIKIDNVKRIQAYNALTIEDVAKIAGVESRSKEMDEIINTFLDDLELYKFDRPVEGAVETLNHLHKNGLIIIYVTGRPGLDYILPFLESMGFPIGPVYYQRIAGEGATEIKKSLLEKAVIENGIDPRMSVSLGDMPHDGIASRLLNIYSIGTTQVSGISPEIIKQYFDDVITHISNLPLVLSRLEKEKRS